MKKITKRILCMVLAMVLLFSATSLASYAATIKNVYFWDLIEYGSYPQSQVKDSALISALDKVNKNWVSYGYYSGNGEHGSMGQGNWMKYADFKYNGSKYRAVTFSQYRPLFEAVQLPVKISLPLLFYNSPCNFDKYIFHYIPAVACRRRPQTY